MASWTLAQEAVASSHLTSEQDQLKRPKSKGIGTDHSNLLRTAPVPSLHCACEILCFALLHVNHFRIRI
jgi:hypothetical protein